MLLEYKLVLPNAKASLEMFRGTIYIRGTFPERGRIFISSPFSRAAVARLVKFKVPAFKIGSGECNNYPLIEHIAKFKKPIIHSYWGRYK